jgi:hypothetical protein
MFSTAWFMTVFLYNLPWNVALRVWDVFMYESISYVYAVAIALLQMHEDKLLQMDFEKMLYFLQFNNSAQKRMENGDAGMDAEELIRLASICKGEIKHLAEKFGKEFKKNKKEQKRRSSQQQQPSSSVTTKEQLQQQYKKVQQHQTKEQNGPLEEAVTIIAPEPVTAE